MAPKRAASAATKRQRSNPPAELPSLPASLATSLAPSPMPTPPPSAPPLSAVAARKAALALLAPSPAEESSSEESSSEEEEEEEIALEDSSADEDAAEDAALAKKKKPVRPKKKPRGAGRYFMTGAEEEREVPQGSTSAAMEVDEEEEVLEVRDELEVLDEVQKTPGKPRMGRGKRQRQEKRAFLDPHCVSSFSPLLDENAHKIKWVRTEDGEPQESLLLCLQAGETVVIHGTYSLTPVFGSISLLGSTLGSSPATSTLPSLALPPAPSSNHAVFAPSSHPLPVIEGRQLPFGADVPSTLALPDGRAIDLSRCSAAVLLSDRNSGVEGVETVLRSSGMGCGNGMWLAGESVYGSESSWGGVGWKLILDPTTSVTSLRTLESWSSTLESFGPAPKVVDDEEDEDDEDLTAGAERMVLLVEGPKRVGKSTFAKLLLNRLLTRYERVAYLDTDLGQPEFTPPGLVSLNVLDQPVLGPSFTHLSLPIASHFLGSTSPASDPSAYLSAISALLATYALEVEYLLVDDLPRHRAHRDAVKPTSRIRDRVPLIINTQGWVKGLGADLLAKLKGESRPTHLFHFDLPVEEGPEPSWNDSSFAVDSSDQSYQIFRMEAAPSTPLDAKWSAADLRTLAFISYFHAVLPPPSSPSPTNAFPTHWDFSLPLVSKVPYALDWTSDDLSSVHILDAEIAYAHVLHALNGSVVALVLLSSSPPALDTSFPYSPRAPLPTPPTSRCVGLALVRSIDPSSTTLHLLTPVHPSCVAEPVALVKGAVELPIPLMLDFLATEQEAQRGVAGVEWREVPYLGVEGEGGRKKVRRNLMRRGQN